MNNYILILSFVGSNFHGWQVQPNLRTVQGTLKDAISTIFDREIKIVGCCRTDAGVHAKEYIANFKADRYMEPKTLVKALNSLLPEDIGILEAGITDENFNARYSVKAKTYVYRIWNSIKRDPFLKPFTWHIPYPLDVKKMEEGIKLLTGFHDFSSFAKLEDDEKNTWIELKEAHIDLKGELIEISFTASHFLRYMVRRMVGSLVYLGMNRLDMQDIKDFIDNKKKCPYTAKAQGLTLEKVFL